jgi:hypothetical protein
MNPETQEERWAAYDAIIEKRRKQHIIRVRDTRILEAIAGPPPEYAGLPEYVCTCGAYFNNEAEADAHYDLSVKATFLACAAEACRFAAARLRSLRVEGIN